MEVIEGIEIPNHVRELEKAEEYIEDVKFRFRHCERLEELSPSQYVDLHRDTLKALFHVAKLSEPAFNVEEKLEEQYFRMYVHSPALAKELFFKKYHEIHKPYNLLKNRCFTLLDQIEELYLLVHKHAPKEFSFDN